MLLMVYDAPYKRCKSLFKGSGRLGDAAETDLNLNYFGLSGTSLPEIVATLKGIYQLEG